MNDNMIRESEYKIHTIKRLLIRSIKYLKTKTYKFQ